MKKYVILTLSIFFFSTAFSQKIGCNIGLGYGTNYGILGFKSVVGKNNTGVLFGLGTTGGGTLGYEIGYQYAYKSFFANVGYGTYAYERKIFPIKEKSSNLHSANIIAGYMVSLGKSKKTFIDLGIGYLVAKEKSDIEIGTNFNGLIGFGYRLSKR